MTDIADAELQRLFAAAIKEQQFAQGIVNIAHDAFISALNARLEAAEAIANRLEWHSNYCDIAAREPSIALLAAYRKSKEGK